MPNIEEKYLRKTNRLMKFKKLRLSGFKSFVDGSDLQIELGLTGVVGPNGCGKSNLVEAIRWVMGETSAKQMRGSEMDDVIFGGTSDRPARNIAEVIVSLDNSDRKAPAKFNDTDELDVSRRIERNKGSNYRVNGHEVRARDVQLLFADCATGARSTALVSQGKISNIISAKPIERRILLEEAAGITGLHSRRHEAELRLRGAETNLERLDDILVTLEAQLAHLKKQVRQANRYRNLSDHIRKAEATFFYLRWISEENIHEDATKELEKIKAKVNTLAGIAAKAATKQAENASRIPKHRLAEAEASAELQSLIRKRDELDADEKRVKEQSIECLKRIEETAVDKAREETLVKDSDSALKNLKKELLKIQTLANGEEEALDKASISLKESNTVVNELEAKLTVITDQTANDEARRNSLKLKITEFKDRKELLKLRLESINSQISELKNEGSDNYKFTATESILAKALSSRDKAHSSAQLAEAHRLETISRANTASKKNIIAVSNTARLKAEVKALYEIQDTVNFEKWPPIFDVLGIDSGYERALAVALGDDLSASENEEAPSYWRELIPLPNSPALPKGTRPLSDFIKAPKSLHLRLLQIGVVNTDIEAKQLATNLEQGQRIVSRSGSLWRWDGYTISANAITPAQTRLEQRNRLKAAKKQLDQAEIDSKNTEDQLAAAKLAEASAQNEEKEAREAAVKADEEYNKARENIADIKERSAGRISLLKSLEEQIDSITTDLKHLDEEEISTIQALTQIPEVEGLRAKITKLRENLTIRRSHLIENQSRYDSLERTTDERKQRLNYIISETDSWTARRQTALTQLELLLKRQEALNKEQASLEKRPDEIQDKRRLLFDALEKSEKNRKIKADQLAKSEETLAYSDRALRMAETELSKTREDTVRLEGIESQAKQSCHALAERIKDRLQCRPDQLFEFSELKTDAEKPELEVIERKVDRLIRERETMGPVNLRAEVESEEMKEQINTLGSEREDLLKAIDKLRRGISELNREGRKRLLASFEEVNKYFQELFINLYGGGKAYLELTQSDDPLEAGLEIMASPPGKRLQVLSLLSGGEQALTALALLFAVFQTNPAPICVLDEVDAPLDDANVDRFCSLVEKMANADTTRFLIITHHRITMARMDRLYGVTMSERGVSQLVSVDLQKADELRATA